MTLYPFDLIAAALRAKKFAWDPATYRFHSNQAFTLLELVVAMAVTVLLIVVLGQVFTSASNAWTHSEVQIDSYREARGALQMMARDLGGTLQACYSPVSATNGSLTTNPALPTLMLQQHPDTTQYGNGPVNEEAYFLTNIPNQGTSSLCSVGYFCQWMPEYLPSATSPRAYALMRQYFDSNATFQHVASGRIPLLITDLFPRVGMTDPSVTQLATFVWDLRFRIDTDQNETITPNGNQPPPPDHSQYVAPYAPRYYSDSTPQSLPPRLPPYVEIRFRALSDLAAQRLAGTNAAVDQSTWADTATGFTPSGIYRQVILPNYQQFVLRVPLLNAMPLPTPTPAP